jgi:transcriptional regulator
VWLRGHVARPNRQAWLAEAALAILRGPDAYVSPTWYADKATQARVPTWNYVVAHLSGPLAWFDDEPSLAALVGELADVHEALAGSDWRFDMEDPAERVQLRGIVGFELQVQHIEFKAKLSQNHPVENRLAVTTRLASSARASDRDVAEWMRDTLPVTHGEA